MIQEANPTSRKIGEGWGILRYPKNEHVQDQQRMARQEQDAEKSHARSEDGVAFSACQQLCVPGNSGKAFAGDEEAAADLGLVRGRAPGLNSLLPRRTAEVLECSNRERT